MPKSEAPPTGQGLRIKISIESTHPPKSHDAASFVSYSKDFSNMDLARRVHESLISSVEEVFAVFRKHFENDVNKIYYPKKGE